MIPTTHREFRFARNWIHAGKQYTAGDKEYLSAADVEKLTRLGAGEVVQEPQASRRPPKRR